MALVTVRPKGAPKSSPTVVVDDSWLTRWPDDYVLVEGEEETADHASISTTQPTDDDPAASRSRF
jgi:hypothetical protein